MKTSLPKPTGKGAYFPPTVTTTVFLCTEKGFCTSNPTAGRSSTTEVWDEEDLSML